MFECRQTIDDNRLLIGTSFVSLTQNHIIPHSEKYVFNSLEIQRNMIVVTICLLIMNPTEFRWVDNHEENSHYDHITFNWKILEISFSDYTSILIKETLILS